MNELKQFFRQARWLFIIAYGIIVSAGAINASYAFAQLNAIDPEVWDTEGIYWVFGVVNLLLSVWVAIRDAKRTREEER